MERKIKTLSHILNGEKEKKWRATVIFLYYKRKF